MFDLLQFDLSISLSFMKILLQYLKPYKWLVVLVLTLAAINIGFSLLILLYLEN